MLITLHDAICDLAYSTVVPIVDTPHLALGNISRQLIHWSLSAASTPVTHRMLEKMHQDGRRNV